MAKSRILVVEDEHSIREILVELLSDEGFDCDSAFDGRDATEKLMLNSYDVLVSDFRMPRMDGAELLKWCRSNEIHLPIVFITANKELLPEEKQALNDCCAVLLHKPIDFDHLIAAIEKAMARNHKGQCPV